MMENIESGIAAIAGTHLYYEWVGSGPALVLIHGFSGDCHMWDEQVAIWAQTFRVIRYDLRGHGRSDMPALEPYSHAGDLEALLDYLGVARAHVVGISMGGWIATHFALTRPQRVEALVLLSPALIGWEWTPEWKTLWSAIAAQAVSGGVAAAKQLWLQHPMFAIARMDPAKAAKLDTMIEGYSGWHWLNRDLQEVIDEPDMERLDRIEAATLIIGGAADFVDFLLIADILRDNIPEAKLLRLAGVGHLVNIEAAMPVAAAVTEFLHAVAAR